MMDIGILFPYNRPEGFGYLIWGGGYFKVG